MALSEAFPSVINPTLKKTLSKWDHIYWLSNDIDRNITYALDITTDFFANNGSMFVAIPMKGIGQEDEIFNFLPVDSLGVLSGIQTNFLLNRNTEVTPADGITGVTLKTESRQVGTYPVKPISGAMLLYEANFLTSTVVGVNQDYEGFEGVAVENPEGNLIYFGLDLINLNGNNNLVNMMNELLIGRLNFKQ